MKLLFWKKNRASAEVARQVTGCYEAVQKTNAVESTRVVILDPPDSAYWKYRHPDGVVSIYIRDRDELNSDRAIFLLNHAIRSLLNGEGP